MLTWFVLLLDWIYTEWMLLFSLLSKQFHCVIKINRCLCSGDCAHARSTRKLQIIR